MVLLFNCKQWETSLILRASRRGNTKMFKVRCIWCLNIIVWHATTILEFRKKRLSFSFSNTHIAYFRLLFFTWDKRPKCTESRYEYMQLLKVQLLLFVYISALFILRSKAVFEFAAIRYFSGSRYLRHFLANLKFYGGSFRRVKKKNSIGNDKHERKLSS